MKILLPILILAIVAFIVFCMALPHTQWSDSLKSTLEGEPQQKAEESNLGALIAVVMIGALIGAIFKNKGCTTLFLFCCLIELILEWQYIIVVLLIVFVFIPMGIIGLFTSGKK